MVEAESPVSENVVAFTPLAIRLALEGVKPEVVLRNTLYVTGQDDVLAVQLKLIWLLDIAVAPRLLGAVGTVQLAPPVISIPLIRELLMTVVN